MKKKRLLTLLFIPLFATMVAFSSILVNESSNNVIMVLASGEKDNFLNRFKEIRTIQHTYGQSICDTTREEYEELIALYSAMSEEERNEVNAMYDEFETSSTIGALMKEIIRIHYQNNGSNEAPKPKLDQSTTIIIAVVVSIFGMSAISVLYILKRDKYIE